MRCGCVIAKYDASSVAVNAVNAAPCASDSLFVNAKAEGGSTKGEQREIVTRVRACVRGVEWSGVEWSGV